MKIGQYCQRQRCKHVELEQFLAGFRVARVCQRQLGFLVLPAFYLQRIIDIFCMFAYVLYLLLLSLDMCELFCLRIFVFHYCKQWRSRDLKKSGIR